MQTMQPCTSGALKEGVSAAAAAAVSIEVCLTLGRVFCVVWWRQFMFQCYLVVIESWLRQCALSCTILH